MESGRRLVRALLALAVLASAASAQASSPPRNVDGFTRYVAGRIAKAMPNANVVVGGPLVIKIDKPEAQEIRLDNIWNYCERDKGAWRRGKSGQNENAGRICGLSCGEGSEADLSHSVPLDAKWLGNG